MPPVMLEGVRGADNGKEIGRARPAVIAGEGIEAGIIHGQCGKRILGEKFPGVQQISL
ncbi:hypothetical protein D3C81_1883870 [compost metagenome]